MDHGVWRRGIGRLEGHGGWLAREVRPSSTAEMGRARRDRETGGTWRMAGWGSCGPFGGEGQGRLMRFWTDGENKRLRGLCIMLFLIFESYT